MALRHAGSSEVPRRRRSRSARPKRGLPELRRSTLSWWRRVAFSTTSSRRERATQVGGDLERLDAGRKRGELAPQMAGASEETGDDGVDCHGRCSTSILVAGRAVSASSICSIFLRIRQVATKGEAGQPGSGLASVVQVQVDIALAIHGGARRCDRARHRPACLQRKDVAFTRRETAGHVGIHIGRSIGAWAAIR
jgi:hypothetical protein